MNTHTFQYTHTSQSNCRQLKTERKKKKLKAVRGKKLQKTELKLEQAYQKLRSLKTMEWHLQRKISKTRRIQKLSTQNSKPSKKYLSKWRWNKEIKKLTELIAIDLYTENVERYLSGRKNMKSDRNIKK